MRAIFHLSLPVRELAEAVDFYAGHLGARIGRRTDGWADALVFGAQVTLQHEPASVTAVMPRTRHFGATLPWAEWEAAAGRLDGAPFLCERPTVSHGGEPHEQAKLMLTDPSGNLIELKAYRHPGLVLGALTEG